MLSKLTIAVLVILSVFISACGGFSLGGAPYSFSDTATFYAPKSKITLVVVSKGAVEEGADLGDGKGVAELTFAEKYTDTITLLTSPETIDTILYRNTRIPFSNNPLNRVTLYDFLDSAGFKQLDKDEVAELADAMTHINYGHKAGFAEGQTRFIQIIELRKHFYDSH